MKSLKTKSIDIIFKDEVQKGHTIFINIMNHYDKIHGDNNRGKYLERVIFTKQNVVRS